MGADHHYNPRPIPIANFTIEGPRHLPALPPCDNETTAAQGRWYRYRSFPVLERELVDEWGYTWQGDKCHLDFYNAIESLDCLENKNIHVYGDSMSRRLAKTLLSGGKWCLDPWAACQDEDDIRDGLVPKLDVDKDGGIVINEMMREAHFERYDTSNMTFGKNTSLFFEFITALSGSSGTWMEPLYDEKDRHLKEGAGKTLAVDAMETVPGAIARPPPEMPPADAVIVGFGAWDQAFTDKFDQYEVAVELIRDAFLQAYPGVPIILRMANSFCCRNTDPVFRRYTGGRIREFDARTRKVFRVDGATAWDGRFRVMDPANMNGRPEVINDYRFSKANHPRASHTRIEMQMVMNSMCRRNSQGKVVFNDYVPPEK
ncbi:MAG: hypothetical protein INR71_06180 [Terriglobus roseus]|nr:hypothetical protein [Terriglobus roseus]